MQKLYSLTRYFIMVIIFFHLSSGSSAQHNKFTGFYINTKGDTIRGLFPQYKQWNHNPDRVNFITSENNKDVVLTPFVCQVFHIDNYDTYLAFQGKRMTNPMIFYQTSFGDQFDKYDTIVTFLREFASSDACKFYIFKDENRYNLYYAPAGGVVIELLQKVYTADNYLIQPMTYKKQLQSLFPDRTEEINHLLYSEEDLVTFLGKEKKDAITIKKVQNGYGGLYVSGGVSLNTLKFTPDASMNFSQKDYGSRPVPVVSIGYIVPFSRNFSRAFFFPQIKFSSLKHTSQLSADDAYTLHSTTFRSSPIISLGFNFGYNVINNPDLQVSVAAGAVYNFLVKFEQIDKYKFSTTNSSVVVTHMDELRPLIDLQVTAIIKKRYVIWSAYNLPTHITIYPSTKDRFTSQQVGVGYKIN